MNVNKNWLEISVVTSELSQPGKARGLFPEEEKGNEAVFPTPRQRFHMVRGGMRCVY